MANMCPNISSPAWGALVDEFQGNEVKAYRAYILNQNEIPEITSEIVKDLKKTKLNFGNDKGYKVVVDKDGNESEQYTAPDGSTLKRVTAKDSTLLSSFSARKKDIDLDWAERSANRIWGKLDHTVALLTDNKAGQKETYDEYVERKRYEQEVSKVRGNIFHKFMVAAINPNMMAQIKDEINTLTAKISRRGLSPIDFKWMLKEDVLKKIMNNVGINIMNDHGESKSDNIKDTVHTEQTVALEEIGYAGTIDLLAEHMDGTHTIVDWKTGKSFAFAPAYLEDILMKYGNQASHDVSDTQRNRAKLQIMWYAIMLKANNPGMKFRNLIAYGAPTEKEASIASSDQYVDVPAFLKMIDGFVSDKAALKEAGLPENLREILIGKDANMFTTSHYTNTLPLNLAAELMVSGRKEGQTLDEKIKELTAIAAKYPQVGKKKGARKRMYMSKEDKAEAMQLQKDIIELQKDPSVMTVEQAYDMNSLTRWVGNYGDMRHPFALQWLNFRDRRVRKVEEKMTELLNKFDSVAAPMIKEWEKANGVFKAGTRVFYDQSKPYDFMYIKEDVAGLDYQRERLLTNKETSVALKLRYDSLTKAQKRVLDFVNEQYGVYFTNKDAFVTEHARTWQQKGQSHIDIFNIGLQGPNKWTGYDGFFPKIPQTEQEVLFAHGNMVTGNLSLKRQQMLAKRKLTSFIDAEYEGWNNQHQDLPIQYMGNPRIEKDGYYSKNHRVIFAKSMESIIRKQELDAVYALGKVTAMRLGIGEDDGPAFEMTAQFIDDKLMSDIQRKLNKSTPNSRKIRVPMWTEDGFKSTPIDVDKVIRMMMNWAGATIMWFRPLQGFGNGVHAQMLAHKRGTVGSIAEKWAGVKGNALDYKEGDILWADKEYHAKFIADAMAGNLGKNKTWLLAKKLNYLGDNFDYQFSEKTILNPKNNYMQRHGTHIFHSIPEEFTSFTTMLAQLHYMKNEVTGKNLYESYEVREILDENKNGTGIYDVFWEGGTRAYVQEGTGINQKLVELTEITPEEIYKMKKVLEREQGGYRREEAAPIEMYAMGKAVIQLKKYLPRLIINAMHDKKVEPHLFNYEPIIDSLTGDAQYVNGKNGEKIPIIERVRRNSEGRWVTIGKTAAWLVTFGHLGADYAWSRLNPEQRMNIIEGLFTMAFVSMSWTAYTLMFADTDDDDTLKKWWKNYLIDNAGQQFNPLELAKTLTSATTPIMFTKLYNTGYALTQMIVAGGNIAIGDEEDAYNTSGELKGWNNMQKGIPLLSVMKDAHNKVTHASDDANEWFKATDNMRFR